MFSRFTLIRGLKIAAALSIIYFVIVGGTAIAIYKYRTQNTWTTRVEKIFPYPAAFVNKQEIPLSRFRKEVAAREHTAAKNNLATTSAEIEQSVINRLVTRVLYANALKEHGITITEDDVSQSMEAVYQQIGGEENLVKYLEEEYGSQITIDDFRVLTREFLTQSAIEKQLFTHADVRHILVAVPENASAEQVETARVKAADIKSKITEPAKFGEIAKQYSEDLASRDKEGQLGTTTRGDIATSFSPEFEEAVFTSPVGQVLDPVHSVHGWHILIIDKREGSIDKSLNVFTEELRTNAQIRLFMGN